MALPKPQTTYAPIGGDTVLTRVQGAVSTAFLRLQNYLTQLRDQVEARLEEVEGVAAAPLTVAEVDGTPSVTGVNTLRFDSGDGFVVTAPSAGVARVDLSGVPQAAIANLTTDLAARELVANKGAASGYAGLDAGAKVPTAQLGAGTASASTYLRGDQTWAALTIPAALTVESAAGYDVVSPTTTLRFDTADGFVITNPAAGVARIDLAAVPQSAIANLTTDLAAKEATANKGVANGYAGLDSSARYAGELLIGAQYQTTLTTTDGTTQTVSMPQIASSSVADYEVTIIGRRTGGSRGTGAVNDGAVYKRTVAALMNGTNTGTPTQIGSTDTVGSDRVSSDLSAAGVAFVSAQMASGGLVQVRFRGATNVNMSWTVYAIIRTRA